MPTQLSSIDRCLNLGLGHHLHARFVCENSECSRKTARVLSLICFFLFDHLRAINNLSVM